MDGVPVGETIFIALTDEKSFAVKTDVDPIDVGFLITLICANLVSVGKSFVESSNLAYTKILSVPSSLYKSKPWPLDGGIIGINLAKFQQIHQNFQEDLT